MVDVNKILQEKIESLEEEIEKMRPVYEWAMRNGYTNYFPPLFDGHPEPVIVGRHVARFYSLFHWNDIDDDTISNLKEKTEKTENILARIYKSVAEGDDTITVQWIMDQLGKVYCGRWWEEEE